VQVLHNAKSRRCGWVKRVKGEIAEQNTKTLKEGSMNIQYRHASKEEVHDASVMWAKGENNTEYMQNYDQFGATK